MPAFVAPEHRADGTIGSARYSIDGAPADGWCVRREGVTHLELGPGYRLLRTQLCGICATDLARHHLPFPLPQVTGHEIVARDDAGRLVAVEINASHAARDLPREAWCSACAAGMPTHCAERLVVGIHGLPGGFSPWILAPALAVVPLPEDMDPFLAPLLEPFAAAWHAVQTIQPKTGDAIAVLGVGRLGSLVLAALDAYRAQSGRRFEIVAILRFSGVANAKRLGADSVLLVDRPMARDRLDVVVETTGSPDGLATALALARREVHLKSTTGEPACGLAHATELVVDELRLVPEDGETLAWLERARPGGPEGAEVVRASSLAEIDAAIRPQAGSERSLVRPRGTIVVPRSIASTGSALLRAIAEDGLRITTSRCGDFRAALPAFASAAASGRLAYFVRTMLPAERLRDGYAAARARGAGKVVMVHAGAA